MLEDSFEFDKIKVKKEKLSPPPEDKKIEKKSSNDILNDLIPSLFTSNNSTNGPAPNDEIEDKKQIEKLKSSNEILAELFKVFNAAPPKTLLNNDFLLENEKTKKHKKHKKQKKKSKKKEKNSSDSESENDKQSIKSEKLKKHRKKKKKSKKKYAEEENSVRIKIKKEKEIEKYSDDNFSISEYEDDDVKGNLSVTIKTEKLTDRKSRNASPKGSKSSTTTRKITIKNLTSSKLLQDIMLQNSKDKGRSNRNKRKKSTAKSDSEISLSDEETYLKESGKNPFYSVEERQPASKTKSRDVYSDKNHSRRDGNSYDDKNRKYEDFTRDRWRSRKWDQHDRRSRSRSRSRKKSRSRDLGIDKKRLLEIARKNAISMFKQGSLPGTNSMTQDIKDKVLLKMRYGGKTVEDLTDFCKKLSNGENLGDLSDVSNGDSDHDRDGNEKAFHHPFVLKDRGPIVMNIKNAIPIVPKTAEQTKTLLMQFPVSSGQHHRANESEWVPVSATKSSENKTPLVTTTLPLKSSAQKNVFAKPLPPEQQQQPAFVPVPVAETSPASEPMEISEVAAPISIAPVAVAPVPIARVPLAPITIAPVAIAPVPIIESYNTTELTTSANLTYQQPPNADSIFPSTDFNIDVSSVITKRLNAMRRLQENPLDSEAMNMMYNAQKDMSAWASSKHVPGQFTGSTGVNVLSAKELNSGTQAWAKRDTLTSTTPVSGGMGMHLLQKMGWKPGEGLGRERNGALQPLLLEVKLDKKGLVADEEDPVKRRQMIQQQQINNRKRKLENSIAKAQESLESKHPVSLLGELASKRKWLSPVYELVEEAGLSHNKTFIFKVIVNDVIYQPAIISNTKKHAKALAAKYCLQQMGILPT